MGRSTAAAPIDDTFIFECFTVAENSGQLMWRVRPDGHFQEARDATAFNNQFAGRAVSPYSHEGLRRVSVTYQGKLRALNILKVGWVLAHGSKASGKVEAVNGDGNDLRASNLRVVSYSENKASKAGEQSSKAGGRAGSLKTRHETDARVLAAMLDHHGASLAELGRVVGLSCATVGDRLGRLEKAGLTIGPQCVPGRSWLLSDKGREFAGGGLAPLDETDLDILRLIARYPLRRLPIARRVGCANDTSKRHLEALAARGLVETDIAKRFTITPTGLEILGVEAVEVGSSWLRHEAISAANAPDVTSRPTLETLTDEQRARVGGRARFKQRVEAKATSSAKAKFNPWFNSKPKPEQPSRSFEDYDDEQRMAG
jgi:predicted transcriptional regulator